MINTAAQSVILTRSQNVVMAGVITPRSLNIVMAGLVPAIHVFGCRKKKVRRGWPA
jgi:hypothetical protein